MKTECKKNNIKSLQKFGITGIVLCAACCTLPIIGSVIGITSLSFIAYYLEKSRLGYLGYWYNSFQLQIIQ